MKKNFMFLLIISILFGMSQNVSSAPGDSFGEPIQISLGETTGQITDIFAEVHYSINLMEGINYEIELTADEETDYDIYLELVENDVLADSTGISYPERIRYKAETTGDYIITVESWGGTGPFTLDVHEFTPEEERSFVFTIVIAVGIVIAALVALDRYIGKKNLEAGEN